MMRRWIGRGLRWFLAAPARPGPSLYAMFPVRSIETALDDPAMLAKMRADRLNHPRPDAAGS